MFVEDHLKDLRRARFAPAAIGDYVRRCAGLSRAAAAARPAAVRGILLSGGVHTFLVVVLAAVFAGTLGPGVAVAYFGWSLLWLAGGMAWMGFHLGMLKHGEALPPTGIGLPNILTLGRLLAIPAFNVLIVRGHLVPSLIVLLAGGLTDVADGMVARRFGASTRLGRVFDPIVDVLFNLGIAVGLTRGGLLPVWLLALILLRYLLLLFGAFYIYVFRGPVRVRPTPLGKTTGVLNSAVLLALIALHEFVHPAAADPLLALLYGVLAVVFSLTIVQVVIIGLYNIRAAGGGGPEGPLSIVVGHDDAEPRS